jgi:hypothetical protein
MSQIPKDARTCYSDKANTDSIAVRKLIQLSTHQHHKYNHISFVASLFIETKNVKTSCKQ